MDGQGVNKNGAGEFFERAGQILHDDLGKLLKRAERVPPVKTIC